ncbi:hypothetical protein K1719_004236 [Acacia pycnantha]|nr:hypothetical protein K1719_004236 [Acacia pycnantha]
MDVSSLKTVRGGGIQTMEDRNHKVRRNSSELPEEVISHILYFLLTKEAVRTSVLSKRWEYIWTSIPKLRFHHGSEPPMDFVNIIYRLLRLRGSFDISSFSLYIDLFEFNFEDVDMMSKIEAWFSGVVGFNVQDVELGCLDGFSPLTLPFSFVNCRTLTSLIISAAGITLKFSSPVCFLNLKKLELIRVTFPDELSTQKLFSGCPLLEDFKLEECDSKYVEAVFLVSPPRLHNFTMIEDDEQTPPSFNGDEFIISGGDLKNFHYEGEFQFEFNILNS